MEYLDFLHANYQKILLVINLILFTEVVSLLFLLIPSEFLTASFNVFVFDFFFFLYFLAILILPWLYIFFIQDTRKFYYIFVTSLLSYLAILAINLVVSLPVHIFIYLILLKSLMVGLSSLFKSLISLIDPKESLEKTDFKFQTKSNTEYVLKNKIEANSHKIDILGGIFFLLIYPLIILVLTYFYGFLKH